MTIVNFVCIIFELGDETFTLSPMENLMVKYVQLLTTLWAFTIFALSAGFLLTKIKIGKTGNQNPLTTIRGGF